MNADTPNHTSKDKSYAFEDFLPGKTFRLGPYQVNAQEIIDFAQEFDPQRMHLDEAAGKASLLGGLAASGWHICSIMMRMIFDGYLSDSTSQGAPSVDFVEWKRPVLAGDVLHGTSTVLTARALNSRPGIGLVKLRQELFNQREELVTASENLCFLGMRVKAKQI